MPVTTALVKVRKPLEPVNPEVELIDYHHQLGIGSLLINGTKYLMFANRDHGKTIGLRLRKFDDAPGEHKCYDIDFTGEHGWTCDCDDATYRPNRPGGCKHVVALRKVRDEMRCQATNN